MPDTSLIVVATFLVPLITEVFTRAGLDKDQAKIDKRLVASVAVAVVMALDILINDLPVPALEVLVANFAILRTTVEGGHVTIDGATKRVGVDLDAELLPGFGIGQPYVTDTPVD